MIKDTGHEIATQCFIERVQACIPVPVVWEGGKNIASRLLTPDENKKVFEALGGRRKVCPS